MVPGEAIVREPDQLVPGEAIVREPDQLVTGEAIVREPDQLVTGPPARKKTKFSNKTRAGPKKLFFQKSKKSHTTPAAKKFSKISKEPYNTGCKKFKIKKGRPPIKRANNYMAKYIQLYRDNIQILATDGIMKVDGRFNNSTIWREVRKRNISFSYNFPHKIATSYAIYQNRIGSPLSMQHDL